MDRSLGTTAQPRIKDVTTQIQQTNLIYGSSDNTNPVQCANRSLNYAAGGSINVKLESHLPLQYQDTVGLFGKENHFVRVDVKINRTVSNSCFEGIGWECAIITEADDGIVNTYEPAVIDLEDDLEIVNDYEPAEISENSAPDFSDAYLTVVLQNLKTGNKYIDSWFDVRLYKSNREEHPYNLMYVRQNDFFYIGFHARNTKRLPYNVKCTVGQEYVFAVDESDKRYLNSVV